ncbi:hypothetical protein L596_007572 [Steinernema carpocapsae]|uniref:Uncharacterized protein n=1 Tax=Steinernema carpocapsae TaxID=34508 RepID=A0A4U5PA44_STECR|nr:hypothetical protein L596_007572 [Steinernema carpocapsae]
MQSITFEFVFRSQQDRRSLRTQPATQCTHRQHKHSAIQSSSDASVPMLMVPPCRLVLGGLGTEVDVFGFSLADLR